MGSILGADRGVVNNRPFLSPASWLPFRREVEKSVMHRDRPAVRMLLALLLGSLVFAVYVPTARNGFINLDDGHFITENPQVRRGLTRATALWALTSTLAWCALLMVIAGAVVRWFPTSRGLVLSVFVLASVAQCLPMLLGASTNFLHEPSDVTFFGFLNVAAFAFLATPVSIVWGGRVRPS
jgi:hypothetical protein